jgi:hypothetical protein
MRLTDRQRSFAAALLDPEQPVPSGLVGPDGDESRKRFSVYRNNVVAGLMEALEAAFPAVCRIVGEEFFRAMARAYVVAEPPTSPILLDYGAGFPQFIAGFEPARSLLYLPDVARIERAWSEAYHAREAVGLDPQAFATIPSDRIGDIRLAVHPSVRIVCSRFPALTIWRMNIGDGVPGPVDLEAGGGDVLVTRPAAEVEVRSMPPGGAAFVATLACGQSLTDAARSAMRLSPSFDLAANLAALMSAGIFIGHSFCRATSEADTARGGT